MCILEPLDRGQMPPIESGLKGRHFSQLDFQGVGTIYRNIICILEPSEIR